jgi:hypothetical protein
MLHLTIYSIVAAHVYLEGAMTINLTLAGLAILLAWTVFDAILHRLALRPRYERDPSLWRSFDHLNVALIYVATGTLIATFVLTYWLFIRPKSFAAGAGFGALLGLALGMASGVGTYIHMPIPGALAWGWLTAGWLKGVIAGVILGVLIRAP